LRFRILVYIDPPTAALLAGPSRNRRQEPLTGVVCKRHAGAAPPASIRIRISVVIDVRALLGEVVESRSPRRSVLRRDDDHTVSGSRAIERRCRWPAHDLDRLYFVGIEIIDARRRRAADAHRR